MFQEISLQRPKTGEEGAYEMDEHGEIGEGDLGISDEEEINRYVESYTEHVTFLRVRHVNFQGNQIHCSNLWTLGIPKMYMGTLGYNIQMLH